MKTDETMEIVSVSGQRPFAPRVSDFTQRFWLSLAEGRFETTVCKECGQAGFPPRPICRYCWSQSMHWRPVATTGHLYTFTRIHVAPRAFVALSPYAIGLVDLEDGLRLMCGILNDDNPLEIGSPVRMVAVCHEDGPLFAARSVKGMKQKDF